MPRSIHLRAPAATIWMLVAALVLLIPSVARPGFNVYDDLQQFLDGGGSWTTLCDFDPAYETALVEGSGVVGGCRLPLLYRSPHGPDPALIYLVGDPDGDGCLAGAGPNGAVGGGSLWIWLEGAHAVAVDIRSQSGAPVTIRVFDPLEQEVFSASGPTSFVGVVTEGLGDIFAIELIPGTLADGTTDATCFDNLRYQFPPLQNQATTWGRVKAGHR